MSNVERYIAAMAKSSKSHLCKHCKHSIPSCDSKIIAFGNGKGDDNIIMCDNYSPKDDKDTITIEISIDKDFINS